MVIERTQSSSFLTALQTTFDGQHPCKLCKFVKAGKTAEQAPEAHVKPPKFEVFSTPLAELKVQPQLCEPLEVTSPAPLAARLTTPLLPPPRVA